MHAPSSTTSLRDGWTVLGAVLRDSHGDNVALMLALAVAGRRRVGGAVR